MRIDVDLATVPPTLRLADPDDFDAFSVSVAPAEHAFVDPAVVIGLAGDRGGQIPWRQQFEQMRAYAERSGWVDDDGAIRAHIAWSP
jgi:hypothetical protein